MAPVATVDSARRRRSLECTSLAQRLQRLQQTQAQQRLRHDDPAAYLTSKYEASKRRRAALPRPSKRSRSSASSHAAAASSSAVRPNDGSREHTRAISATETLEPEVTTPTTLPVCTRDGCTDEIDQEDFDFGGSRLFCTTRCRDLHTADIPHCPSEDPRISSEAYLAFVDEALRAAALAAATAAEFAILTAVAAINATVQSLLLFQMHSQEVEDWLMVVAPEMYEGSDEFNPHHPAYPILRSSTTDSDTGEDSDDSDGSLGEDSDDALSPSAGPRTPADASAAKLAARLRRFSTPPAAVVPKSTDDGGSAECPIHILNLFAGINNTKRTLIKLGFDFAKIVAHYENDVTLASLLLPPTPRGPAVFADVNDILSHNLPWFNCLLASPPCQPWSVRGEGRGVNDPRAATMPRIHQALQRFQPRGAIIEQVEHFFYWQSRGLHSKVNSGPAYNEFAARVVLAGFVLTKHVLPASYCRSMQSRRRLFLFATRADVAQALGNFSLPDLPMLPHKPIAFLLQSNASFYDVVAPASAIKPLRRESEHRPHLPHKLGSFDGVDVWADTGLSPCILTGNRLLFEFRGKIVELNLLGLCELQGIDPACLPTDPVAARAAVGNSIDAAAHEFVMRHYLLYLKRACSLPRLPPSKARVPFPGYDPTYCPSPPAVPTTPTEVWVPEISDGDTTTAALPGIDLDTLHEDDDPVIDWAVLQPMIDQQRGRWEQRAQTLTDEQATAFRWDCSDIAAYPWSMPTSENNPLTGCAHVRAVPTAVDPEAAARRAAVIRTYTAVLSDTRPAALRSIVCQASAFEQRLQNANRPTPVSPSRQQWLEGQLQHLTTASSTPDGVLRNKQIQHLVQSGSPPTPSALIPATVPVSIRSPWAGFSRPITFGSVGQRYFNAEMHSETPSLPHSQHWSTPADAILRADFDPDSLAQVDVLTIRVSCTPDSALREIEQGFATTAALLATQRPLVLAFVTPRAIWVSEQVNAVCPVESFINGLAGGLDMEVKHTQGFSHNCKVSILSPTEVASRLAFREAFDFSATTDSVRGPSLLACVEDYLRPRRTFRVTNIEQVWPAAHRIKFAAWKANELIRARKIRAGESVGTPEVLVLDEQDLHHEARGVVWDLRAYWAATAYGKDEPSLIVPLCNIDALDSPFNHEALRALTGLQRTPFPDAATVHDLEFGFDNTADPPKHSCFASNWSKSYEYYDIGNKDIASYLLSGFVECCDAEGPAFVPSTAVGQNTVPKPHKDPELYRRRVLDCSHPRGSVVANGKVYVFLSLNSRIDVSKQAEVSFSNFDRIASKAMSLARSEIPVLLFKTDGDAWYKQFFRRLACVADGVASWPDFLEDPPIMKMFHDFRLQFGDASAAHRAYRVCYMTIWLALQDATSRPAKNPAVRAWQKLQLELVEQKVISETNLSYADIDGFIDDFMGMALEGEDWELLASLLALMDLLGIKYAKAKTEAPHYKKVMLGFILDMKRRIAYLEPEWRNRFIVEIENTLDDTNPIGLHTVQTLGGKAIRVCCLFPPLRAYCNGIFACLRALKHKQCLSFAQKELFKHDIKLIQSTLTAAPSVHLLFEPQQLASIADGAVHLQTSWIDTDASTSWGLGAVLFTADKIFYLQEEWTDEEKALFDIAELEAMAYDMAFKFFPAVVPEHFARKQLVGRIDSEVARFAFTGRNTKKGVIDLCLTGLLRSQVRHHFHLHTVRVATDDNIFADDLSRGDLEGFIMALAHTGKQLVRLRLSDSQRSTAAYKAAKAAFPAA